jgi:flagellar hook-associated protein 2
MRRYRQQQVVFQMVTSTSSTSTAPSSIGTSILTSLGASTINTSTLVDQLATADIAGRKATLDSNTATNTAQISDIGTVISSMTTFQSSLKTLISGGSLFTQPTTSNSSILTVSAVAGAKLNGLSSTITVNQLAMGQTLVAPPVSGLAATIGQGKLTLTVNGQTATITIDSTNNTLAGLAQAIKNAGLGVTATTINDTSGTRLVLKGPTGSANDFSLVESDGGTALSQFTFDPATYNPNATTQTGFTRSQQAQDAKVNVDGVDVVKSTNSFSDVLQGVTINLQSAQPGTSVFVGSNQPVDAIKQAVGDFVDAYNEVQATLSKLTAAPVYNSDGTSSGGGSLNRDSGVRALVLALSGMTSTPLTYATDGGPTTLAEIGVSTNKDGTLSLNSSVLSSVMTSNPDAVEAMFNPSLRSDNPLIQITSTPGSVAGGVYQVTNAVPAPSGGTASATLDGNYTLPNGANGVMASLLSAANGLSFNILGNVASSTITVDPGLLGVLSSIVTNMTSSSGALTASQNTYNDQKTALATAQQALTDQDATNRAQLTAQYSAMTAALAAYTSTQNYLTQQIKVWTGGTTSNG